MSRLVREAAGRASGARRPSPASSPPPHRSGCPGVARGAAPSLPLPRVPGCRPDRSGIARGQSGGREQPPRAAGWGWGAVGCSLSKTRGGSALLREPSPLPPLCVGLRRVRLRPELVGDRRVQAPGSRAARQRAAEVRSLPRGPVTCASSEGSAS